VGDASTEQIDSMSGSGRRIGSVTTTSIQNNHEETNTSSLDALKSIHDTAIEGVGRLEKLRLQLQRVDFDWWNVGYTGELRGLYVQLRDESRHLKGLQEGLRRGLLIVGDILQKTRSIEYKSPLIYIGARTMTAFSVHHSVCEALLRVSQVIQTECLDKLDDEDQPKSDSSSSFWISERIDCVSKVCRSIEKVDFTSTKMSLDIEFSLACGTLRPEAAGSEVRPASVSKDGQANLAIQGGKKNSRESKSPDDVADEKRIRDEELRLHNDWKSVLGRGVTIEEFIRDRGLRDNYTVESFRQLVDRVRKRLDKKKGGD
jgi:hypothetical protein